MPQRKPMKDFAVNNQFWQSDTFRLIQMMKATGNRPGVILQWKELVSIWALDNAGTPDGKALCAWLPLWQIRPFYTAAELAPMFPVLAVTFGIAQLPTPQRSPTRLANELDLGGLPKLLSNDREDNFFQSPLTGQWNQYYIVERLHHWRVRGMLQDEFNEQFKP